MKPKEKLQELIKIGKKICSKCGIEKTLDRFRFEKRRNKHRAECRDCERKRRGQKPLNVYLEEKRLKNLEVIKKGEKKCKICSEAKSLNEFRKDKRFDYCFNNMCKQCERERDKLLQKAWAEKRRLLKPSKSKLTPEEKQKRAAEHRELYKIKSRSLAREKYWNDSEFREKRLQEGRERHQKDRSIMLARNHKREAIMVQLHDGSVTPKEIARILNERKTCPYCGKGIKKPELDHMDPLSRGGLHSIYNLIGCCHFCNSYKHNKTFKEWLLFIPNKRKDYVYRLYTKKHEAPPEQGALQLRYGT